MALDKTILGESLYSAANAWNDVDVQNIEQARKDFWNAIAAIIVTHIQTNGTVPALGLVAPGGTGGPVTGSAKIQ